MVATPYTPLLADELPAVRRIAPADLRWALARGWEDFREKRGDIVVIGLVYPLVGLVVAALAAQQALVPLLFPLVAGLSLLGPVVAAGFYELARRRETGDDPGWRHFLDVYRPAAFRPLAAVALGLALLFLAWIGAAWALYVDAFGTATPASTGRFLSMLFGTAEGWQLIVVGNLVGLLFALVVLATTTVSLPMLIDRPVEPGVAVATSIRAFRANPGTLSLWGLIVAGLIVAGSLLLFVGLAVVLPVLGYATWHLYTRLVERGA